jgi:hypothetical protein
LTNRVTAEEEIPSASGVDIGKEYILKPHKIVSNYTLIEKFLQEQKKSN